MPKTRDENRDLRGVGVLITRPAHQAHTLADLIERAGGTAIRFPTIEVGPPVDPGALLPILDRLAEFHLAIFVSVNAVEQAFAWLAAGRHTWPATLAVAAVGQATARALSERGYGAIAPAERFDSESLLALPALQTAAGKRVVIFRGDGGRETLAEMLAERGAAVTYAECYRRLRPQADAAGLVEHWRRGAISIVTVTSTEGIRNLHDMLEESGRDWLLHTPIVVLSESQAAACRLLGFATEPLIAPAASDEAILETIRAWRHPRFSL